jgi:co-chaperonin GroES (HSP10)|tara:strand:- start:1381 stop:1812 length:432 start_codon:yes stop_codon:yes gene_type:complete
MTLIKPNTKLVTPKKDVDEPLVPKGAKETEEYLKLLPKPVGYRLLIRPYQPKAKTKGGLYLTEKTLETQQMTTVVGLVVKMGDLCYKDKEKFPTGPWCQEGQFIVYGRYAGARFKTKYGEHRILNDDEIIGTINKPEDILALF